MMTTHLRDQSIIIINELKPHGKGMAGHDRIVSFDEMENYIPGKDVNAYSFRGVKPGTIAKHELTDGRLLDAETVHSGRTVLVGELVPVGSYLDSLPEQSARNVAHNFAYEVMCGVCIHPTGHVSEVRGSELIFDSQTRGFRDMKQLNWHPW